MKIMCIGDVCGQQGCDTVRRLLPSFKRQNSIDFVIANGENSAVGNGILPVSATHLFASGVDVITGGNHSFKRNEICDFFDSNESAIRPANMPSGTPGAGYTIVDFGYARIAVVNLLGTVYMESLESPFEAADRILKELSEKNVSAIVIDFHAEATSEKRALGYYLDGRATVLFGTHTHVATADASILPKGMGYITDLGMTGPIDSVLGVDPQIIITKQVTKMPVRFKIADGDCSLCGAIFTLDLKNGTCAQAQGICLK